jgi:hypothetical protein
MEQLLIDTCYSERLIAHHHILYALLDVLSEVERDSLEIICTGPADDMLKSFG